MHDDLLCYIGQKAFIDRNGELLILHDPQMGLDLPGGKVQVQESDLAAALRREVFEETGLEIRVAEPFCCWLFTVPPNSSHRAAGKQIFTVGYRCRYVFGSVRLSLEHDWFKWVNKETYRQYSKHSNYSKALKSYWQTAY